jgi:two-component system NtrC family response regulator
LFLDEVGELRAADQAKLLRALDAREIIPVGGTRRIRTDARVVAATNIDLASRISQGEGGFRADLYARLAGTVIRMPPLRARRGDILGLAECFLAQQSPAVARALSAQAAERLVLHPWPRNVRELRSAMRRLALQLGDRVEVTRADVELVLEAPAVAPIEPPARPSRGASRSDTPTREELATRLAELRGNVSQLAGHYAKDAKQIYRWLKRYRLDPDSYR